ncbi:2-hydroxyacyl-CoA lyase 2 isoform X2 [Corvus hawaiiensis]|nr:2-hydroxyacyl-CoA lyase 2 isoform X2 [Corvus hawaiiensis]
MDLVAGLGCACAGLVALALLVVAQRLGLLYRLCHKVDTASPRHGGELVAEVLRAHGVRFLFTLPGGHISPVLVACEKLGIRVVDTRHEATAVFAADAVSRLSGRIGVAAVTAGPGVTNTVTAVKNAQMAESPLLLLGGAAATLQKVGTSQKSPSQREFWGSFFHFGVFFPSFLGGFPSFFGVFSHFWVPVSLKKWEFVLRGRKSGVFLGICPQINDQKFLEFMELVIVPHILITYSSHPQIHSFMQIIPINSFGFEGVLRGFGGIPKNPFLTPILGCFPLVLGSWCHRKLGIDHSKEFVEVEI